MDRPLGAAPAFGATWNSIQPPLSPWMWVAILNVDTKKLIDTLRSLDVIRKMGFERTTPVQAGTIPRALKNQDCVVEVSCPTPD